MSYFYVFFFKQKTAYEMRISDWSSDVCSSDLPPPLPASVPPTWTSRRLSLSTTRSGVPIDPEPSAKPANDALPALSRDTRTSIRLSAPSPRGCKNGSASRGERGGQYVEIPVVVRAIK